MQWSVLKILWLYNFAALFLSCGSKYLFLSLKLIGVTSNTSSSAMYAIICSNDIFLGGTNFTASSVPDARTFVNCLPFKKDIKVSIKKVYSNNFQKLLNDVKNPYENGISSKKIVKILKKIQIKNILKKNFHDINFRLWKI